MNDQIIQAINDHAAREFPIEACGLVIDSGAGHYVLACENKAHDPAHSFLIDPLVYHAHCDRIAAVYHSHPNRSPEPSAADIASAERCCLPFLILSYPSGEIHTYAPKGGLPADYEGRDFVYGVNDCLSLVTDYYRHELGILIEHGERKQWEWWMDAANFHAFINGWKQAGFVEVSEPKPNDLIIMALRSVCPNHVAIYMGNNQILHHPSTGTPSRREMYGHHWRSNTVCFLGYAP